MRYPANQIALLLGSNIQPELNLPWAIELLNERFLVRQVSSTWETPAVGSDGPNFLNAAILLESHLSPRALKTYILRPMEVSLGRVRTRDKNAPRTIDLDVVVWGNTTWDEDIWQHAHAAVPAAELLPDLRHDQYSETLAQVAEKLQSETEIHLRSDITWRIQSRVGVILLERIKPTNMAIKVAQSIG